MKLKKLLNENLWNERKFGESLPTLEDTTKAYKLKKEDLNEKVFKMTDKDNIRLLHREVKTQKKSIVEVGLGAKYIREILNKEKIGDPGKKLYQLYEQMWKEIKNIEKQLPGFQEFKKMIKLTELVNENDLSKVSSILGKSSSDVNKFLKKYKLDADDLLDVIETGGRRYSLAIMAAMKGNRRALRQLDDLLGFL